MANFRVRLVLVAGEGRWYRDEVMLVLVRTFNDPAAGV